MEYSEIILQLQKLGSEKYKSNVVKLGIPKENSLGVSTMDLRKLAKQIKINHELAKELWASGYHEARLLAVLLFDPKKLSLADVEALVQDIVSWDLCDCICTDLLIKIKDYQTLIPEWLENEKYLASDKIYFKRAAFVLITKAVVHENDLQEELVNTYFEYIKIYSDDDRVHVKKAVSWALREIGKKSVAYQKKSIPVAQALLGGSKSQVWIAKDALKELENLVEIEGRKRLYPNTSKMGRDAL